MGFKRERRLYKLVFEDPELAGLEVVARSASVGKYVDIADLATTPWSDKPTEADVTRVKELFAAFAEVLVSWNLEEDITGEDGSVDPDVPVPATLAGLLSQDFEFVLRIIVAWMESVAGSMLDLPGRPDSSGPLPEHMIPMQPLGG